MKDATVARRNRQREMRAGDGHRTTPATATIQSACSARGIQRARPRGRGEESDVRVGEIACGHATLQPTRRRIANPIARRKPTREPEPDDRCSSRAGRRAEARTPPRATPRRRLREGCRCASSPRAKRASSAASRAARTALRYAARSRAPTYARTLPAFGAAQAHDAAQRELVVPRIARDQRGAVEARAEVGEQSASMLGAQVVPIADRQQRRAARQAQRAPCAARASHRRLATPRRQRRERPHGRAAAAPAA